MYELRTTIDITKTGARRNYVMGVNTCAFAEWELLRNKQRNYDVVVQLLSLRGQPNLLSDPVYENEEWVFEFEYDREDVNIEQVIKDFDNVPVVSFEQIVVFCIDGDNRNISIGHK